METQTTPGRRERRKSATRAALIEAAYELFAADGFGATTMDDIAERADVSRRTAFRYFPTKEALIFPERDSRLTAFEQLLEPRPDESAFETVRRACLAMSDSYGGDRKRLMIQWSIIQSEPSLMGRELQLDRAYEQALERAFQRDEPNTAVGRRRAALFAGSILGMVRVVLRSWLEGGAQADLAHLGREAFDLLSPFAV